MTETTLIAWATTSTNTVGADAGISVVERDIVTNDQGSITDQGGETEVARNDAPLPDEHDGHIDVDAADEMLSKMGFSRIDPWTESGGQWAAEVECIDA